MESTFYPWSQWPRNATLLKALQTAASLPNDKRVAVTSPSISSDSIGDPMDDLAKQHNIVRASKLNKEGASASGIESSLNMFVKNGCWQHVLDTTSAFLCAHGQGPPVPSNAATNVPADADAEGAQENQSQPQPPGDGPALHHTHMTLQIWLYRSVALWKLRMYSTAFTELSSFGSFDQIDLCYEYYPTVYPERKGSMVPFSLRVIRAELPAQLGQFTEALDQLCVLKHACEMALQRLASSLDEDGNSYAGTDEEKEASQKLWRERIERLNYGIGNCLLGQKEYELAMEVFEGVYDRAPSAALSAGLGRIALLLGDTPTAEKYFSRSATNENAEHNTLVHNGLIALSGGDYAVAADTFKQAWEAKKTCAVAGNNYAVCQLYMGLLGDATASLTEVLEPEENLEETLVFNLCTLYELQSSSSVDKKKALVPRVVNSASDAFDLKSLKLGAIAS